MACSRRRAEHSLPIHHNPAHTIAYVTSTTALPIHLSSQDGKLEALAFSTELLYGGLDPNGEAQSPAPLSFAAWQAVYFPTGGDASPDADPDLDGMSNAVEYFSATDPGSSRDAAAPIARTVPGAGGGPSTELTLRRRPGTAPWLLETSADLVSWSRVAAAPGISPNADGSETATWCLPLTEHRACYRARAVIP